MLIGVTGLIGSGKDTIADYLVTFHRFKRISFAGALKDAVAPVFNWDRELLEGQTAESRKWREEVDPWWAKRLGIPHLTPRWILQQWGTEVLRRNFHNDIWVASVENKLLKTKDNVVITDCRFANELYTIKSSGGIAIRVMRGVNPAWFESALLANSHQDPAVRSHEKEKLEALKIHASEYSSVGLKYDHYIDNNGTLAELHARIESIINN
jgi:hypothetical protein